jgi:hypothetical protein
MDHVKRKPISTVFGLLYLLFSFRMTAIHTTSRNYCDFNAPKLAPQRQRNTAQRYPYQLPSNASKQTAAEDKGQYCTSTSICLVEFDQSLTSRQLYEATPTRW